MIKIDVISGFLGAGKTTFCNLLLRYYLNKNIHPVYIVNEFGSTSIDADIIRSEGFVSENIEGGCICCTLKGDVVKTIQMVIQKYNPTNIIFEPSGVFLFSNFLELLQLSELAKYCEIGSMITIVDSLRFDTSRVVFGSFIYNQIKSASIILLSKTSSQNSATMEQLCDIKNINPNAVIFSKPWVQLDAQDFEVIMEGRHNIDVDINSLIGEYHHTHFQEITIHIDKEVTVDCFQKLCQGIEYKTFGSIYRGKGIFKLNKKLVLVQIIVSEISLLEFKGMAETNITFIGTNINTELLQNCLQA